MSRRNQPESTGFYVDKQGRYHTSGWKPKEHGPIENFKDQFSAWRLSKQTSGVNGFFNNLNSVLDGNALEGIMNRLTGAALTPAEREANEWSASQAELAFNRELEASNTAKQRQVADMQAAGINPIMAVSQGVSLPASASPSSVSPSASAFSMSDLLNMFRMKELLPLEKASLEASIQNTRANTSNTEAHTEGTRIENKYKDIRERLYAEGQELANELTYREIRHVDAKIDSEKQNLHKMIAETKNEEAKHDLIVSEALLNNANAEKLYTLIPFEKALMSANTDAARARAKSDLVHAAYEQGIIDSGIIDINARAAGYHADSAEYKSSVDRVEAQIRGDIPIDPNEDYGPTDNLVKGVSRIVRIVLSK